AVEQHFDHHDAGVAGALSLRHLETEAQIDHRNDTSPQIDDAAHEVRRAGNLGDGGEVEHFAHLGDIDAEDLVAQLECEVLPRLGNFVDTHLFSFRGLEGRRACLPMRAGTGQKRSNSLSRLSPLSFSLRATPDLAVLLTLDAREVCPSVLGGLDETLAAFGARRAPRAGASVAVRKKPRALTSWSDCPVTSSVVDAISSEAEA